MTQFVAGPKFSRVMSRSLQPYVASLKFSKYVLFSQVEIRFIKNDQKLDNKSTGGGSLNCTSLDSNQNW